MKKGISDGDAFLIICFLLLDHQCCNESQDSIELRERSVDHCVSLYVVALSDALDTVSTNLTLTDSRVETYYTYSQTYCEVHVAKTFCAPHKKCYETVETLCCWHG